ncbi:hypothetical protein H4R19_000215 [Coemansia spiralis]|nr:hypothetical protein H4R19_000215 [Coemansia spiralis]
MAGAESDMTELFVHSAKCTGDVPPALVGSSATYLGGRAYVFGGRALHSGKLSNDIYACDLQTFKWRRVDSGGGAADAQTPAQTPTQPGTPVARTEQQARARAAEMVAPPPARFFHSATAFRHYLIVFGGMGLDVDPDAPVGPVHMADMRSTNIQDDRNQQSFQVRTSKTLLGDMAVFDTQLECWVARRALDADPAVAPAELRPDSAAGTYRPSPRYAHLSTLLGSRLLLVGGQDLEEQYVEELNVFDLQLGRWVLRSPFPRAVGLYRSFIASVPAAGSTLLYSNYSFSAVKRALYLLSSPPDCTLKEISDQLDGEPPGLRFPRGHLVDPHTVIMSGTLISTEGHSEMSLWALDTRTLHWQPVSCGAKLRTGSWNQSVVDPRTNTLVLFGDSRRDLNYDYQRRRLNYAEVRAIDLRALGYERTAQPPGMPAAIASSPFAAAHTAAAAAAAGLPRQSGDDGPGPLSFELGAQLMHLTQFNDGEVVADDGSCVAEVNTGLLRARWPEQTRTWLDAGSARKSASPPSRDSHTDGEPRRPISAGAVAAAAAGNGVRRLLIDGPREAVCVLVFFLYTGVVEPAARFGLHQTTENAGASGKDDQLAAVRVLGELLLLATKYSLVGLAQKTADQLRWRVTPATAPLVFEAALRVDDQSLQARGIVAVRDHISALRADRQSPLYMVSSTARASIMRYFPKLQDIPEPAGDMARSSMAHDRAYHQGGGGGPQYALAPNPRQMYHPESRQRSTSDAHMAADAAAAAAAAAAVPRNGAPPSPSSSAAGSPASTLRGSLARSPYPAHDGSTPRRPWDATMMGSPVINSPASSRYSGQSPEIRGNTIADSSSGASASTKRLSGVSHLAAQPLPEDIAVSYAHNGAADPGSHASRAKRASRYLGGIGITSAAAPAVSSVESVDMDRRPSDTSSLNEAAMHMQQLQPPQPPQQQQPQQPQQQPQQQQSSRSLIFRPWNKMKKIASSNQVSTDSLPPVPTHSTYSGPNTH